MPITSIDADGTIHRGYPDQAQIAAEHEYKMKTDPDYASSFLEQQEHHRIYEKNMMGGGVEAGDVGVPCKCTHGTPPEKMNTCTHAKPQKCVACKATHTLDDEDVCQEVKTR